MTGRDVERTLFEHKKPVAAELPAQVQEHLLTRDRCRDFVRTLSPSVADDAPSPEILRQIERTLALDLRSVRPLAPARYFFAAFAGIFILIVAVGIYHLGAFAMSVMSSLQSIATLGTLAAGAGLLAYSLAHQMVPGSRHRVPPNLSPAVVIGLSALVIAGLFQFQHERDFWGSGWACLRAGTPLGLLAAVPFWLLLRQGALLAPRITGAAMGLLSGLVGTSTLGIHCPILNASHILIWHLGIALLGAVVGLAAGFAGEAAQRHLRSAQH
jgi:negative regulator of sigma F NrsF-like protein